MEIERETAGGGQAAHEANRTRLEAVMAGYETEKNYINAMFAAILLAEYEKAYPST